jgi:hypothetical protein
MASVAKWLRQWIVVPPLGGSSPLVRPNLFLHRVLNFTSKKNNHRSKSIIYSKFLNITWIMANCSLLMAYGSLHLTAGFSEETSENPASRIRALTSGFILLSPSAPQLPLLPLPPRLSTPDAKQLP